MDQDEKYVWVPGKLFASRRRKSRAASRLSKVKEQRSPKYAGLFSCFRRDLAGHGTFKSGNALLAVPLFRQSECFCLWITRTGAGRSSYFRLLSQNDGFEPQRANVEDKNRGRT